MGYYNRNWYKQKIFKEMTKVFLVIICVLTLGSCASSTFYAYENVDDEVYCTIEVDRKGFSTYRGIGYTKYADWSYKRFIYMRSDYENLEGYLLLEHVLDIYHIDETDTSFDISLLFYKSDSCDVYSDIIYVLEENDSASFIEVSDCLLENPVFLEVSRDYDWLPPYFKKVDKIDYSKFSMFKVKKKFLKNPEKKGAPKSRG